MEGVSANWPLIGLTLALELLGAIGLAMLVRFFAKRKLHGQTYWMVVAGVAGTLAFSAPVVGCWPVAFILMCFAVTGFVMGVEYFWRISDEAKKAQDVLDGKHE
jgi:mannose/fructose/N-acetylgalactosamine-specific phosphotransferase system component IIC